MTDQHPPAPGRFAHASGSSTDEQSTDPSDASDSDADESTHDQRCIGKVLHCLLEEVAGADGRTLE